MLGILSVSVAGFGFCLFVCLFVCFGLDSACMLQLFEFCQHNRQQLVDGDEVMLNVLRYQLTY